MIFAKYTASLWNYINDFNILKSDRRFTKTPAENIKLAQNNAERFPTLVFNDAQQCIAFFTLHIGEGVKPYTDNPDAVFFRSFSVDNNFRGEGVGRAVIENLPTYVADTFPTIDEIYLTVNTDNEVALQLYKKCNYCYIGDADLEGKPVHILKYSI
ncbi:GNAT family N-acetyltransferase [Staphylococcus kloosii]|jgi:ribosomal protein S18 acetylase RimI-like enzyme|uniref:N-acetyltransferase n=1 Tax=Staphylococcus kloosii TaxID=29384 RepID=A0ABQ0XPU8_9STAP|nr:GNAT family N-acetyltransferase [Staphylococcus kloosii]MBF7023018.1 GNAT family N-acetyltransferase [Staphylococcus kloosii]PNZ04367.1 GNAT family N-acetyltransferase [Staphylococcus kloosii]GEP82933.1 N-acetyltransferase [Staphylococcus kloosii]SUM50213.1 putative acetyltransferase [Staphylococcus kloosii]